MLNKKTTISAISLILIIVAFFTAVFLGNGKSKEYVTYNEFLNKVESKEIKEVTLSDSPEIQFKEFDDETTYTTDNPRNPDLKEKLLLQDVKVVENSTETTLSWIQTILSVLFLVGGFFFVYKLTNKNNMKSAMVLNVSDINEGEKVIFSFKDIAGNEEAKESVQDLIDFIRNPEKYSFYGARLPHGVIFYGPPGTGKTMMAKAVAGEGGVPFYAVSGSDFVQMYVGVGANRIRELFRKARSGGRAVIFIDEIDALGKTRSSGTSGGNDERDQTLNALLTEMSGFSSKEGIIVIAATNRLDTLDEALLRPGRFDRHVEIGLPDINARHRILCLHSKNKPLSEDIDLYNLAKETVFFSGAMLENLLNEAAIFAAKTGKSIIKKEDLEKAYYTILAGSEKKDRSNILEKEKNITAYHEAGHALLARLTAPENIVSRITIIPSTKGIGGFCVNIPPEKMYYTKKELESQIMINFGGRASEEIIFGKENITTGASNDIEKASHIIKDYVIKYGMGDKKGLLNTSVFNNANVDIEECSIIMERLYDETLSIIRENKEKLVNLAEELILKESLCQEDLERLVG